MKIAYDGSVANPYGYSIENTQFTDDAIASLSKWYSPEEIETIRVRTIEDHINGCTVGPSGRFQSMLP